MIRIIKDWIEGEMRGGEGESSADESGERGSP